MMPYLKADDMKDSLMAFQIYLMGKHEAHLWLEEMEAETQEDNFDNNDDYKQIQTHFTLFHFVFAWNWIILLIWSFHLHIKITNISSSVTKQCAIFQPHAVHVCIFWPVMSLVGSKALLLKIHALFGHNKQLSECRRKSLSPDAKHVRKILKGWS
jgi:hypothetical protein